MPSPTAYNDTSYVSPAIFTLTSLANTVNWYTDTLSSGPIATGSQFITPLLSNNTTYYIREIGGQSSYGGPLDTNIGTGSYYYGDKHLIFDSHAACNLVSADFYAEQTNAIIFEVRDNNGNVIDDTTITVYSGMQTLYLDFDIPIGNDLQLGLGNINAGLYKNNNGAVFPYTISNFISITGANNSGNQNNWYNYYNLQFKEKCISNFSEATAVFILPSNVESIDNDKLLVYPNPTTNLVNISNDQTIYSISIFDMNGSLILNKSYQKNNISVNTSDFAKGVYSLKIVSTDNSSVRQLIIK